ncbi:MAG: hypothetical protein GU356_12030 [Pyrobaculum sp.]|nr:hypothetical protein [Pyrobaculum sp.]
MMIELLAVQAITTAALAAVIIELRRELFPMIATAGQENLGFWIRSVDVLAVETPQFEVSKTVVRIRWQLTEELFLIHRLRFYNVAIRPSNRGFYQQWKAWLNGDSRYRCVVEKPRRLARIYSKAIEVVCYDMENEKDRRLWEVIEIMRRGRKR